MKKILVALIILFSLAANAVENSGFLKLASGKTLEVTSYGEIKIPENLGYGRTFQIMYLTKIPVTDDVNLQKEAAELIEYLRPTLDKGNYKTAYLRATGVYTDKMLTSKNGLDFKFIKNSSGEWVAK